MKTNLLLAVIVCIMCSARAAPAVDEAKPLAYGSYGTRYADKPIEKVLVLIAPEGTTFSRDLKISFVAGSPTNLQSSPQLSLSEQYQQPSVQQYGSAYQALQPSYPYGQMPPAAPSLPQYLPYGAAASPGYRVMSASKTVEKKEESK